jgi:hypothetical protein
VAIGPHPQGGQPHPCLPARGGPAAALGLALALPGRLRHVDPAPIDAHHRRRAGEAGGLEGRAPAFQTHADAVQGLQGEDLPSGPVQGSCRSRTLSPTQSPSSCWASSGPQHRASRVMVCQERGAFPRRSVGTCRWAIGAYGVRHWRR